MRQTLNELLAITQSNKFTAYAQGVTATLPTGESLVIKTQQTKKSKRPVGLRYSNYAFVTAITAGPHRARGYGEAPTQILAIQKSIAEGVERVLYRALKKTPHSSPNSNGWAAHLNQKKTFNAALEELLERDAVLVHWLCKKPMSEISQASWPKWLTSWSQNELIQAPSFRNLRILVSTQGHIPTVTTILHNHDSHAVLSHATAATLNEAVTKALAETCRIAQIAIEGTHIESSARLKDDPSNHPISPEDHAMFYAFHEKLPTWIFGPVEDWNPVHAKWKATRDNFDPLSIQAKYHPISDGPLVVGYCTSPFVQKLFFGPTSRALEQGLINFKRLKEIQHEGPLNLMPHCVP